MVSSLQTIIPHYNGVFFSFFSLLNMLSLHFLKQLEHERARPAYGEENGIVYRCFVKLCLAGISVWFGFEKVDVEHAIIPTAQDVNVPLPDLEAMSSVGTGYGKRWPARQYDILGFLPFFLATYVLM
jgi:hypothetical protein